MRKALYQADKNCVLLKRNEAVEHFNLSASTIDRISKECGAKVKIGRAARYHKEIIQQYIDSLYS